MYQPDTFFKNHQSQMNFKSKNGGKMKQKIQRTQMGWNNLESQIWNENVLKRNTESSRLFVFNEKSPKLDSDTSV